MFECVPEELWKLLMNWEWFLAVGLPGQTSNFKWLSGGPGEVPSTFQFATSNGDILKEGIYEGYSDPEGDRYRFRYRSEPVLNILEYDAMFELQRRARTQTLFTATRDVRLEPGSVSDMLSELIEFETRCLKEHFAA